MSVGLCRALHRKERKTCVQGTLYNLIAEAETFDARKFLKHRWKRWFTPGLLDDLSQRATVVAKCLQGMPPFCIAAVLRTWLNGWSTKRRFQQKGQCVFGCDDAEDSIEHYACCSRLWSALPQTLLAGTHGTLLRMLLLADAAPEQDSIRQGAVALYVVYQTYNTCAHGDGHNDPVFLRNTAQERFRFACERSNMIQRLFHRSMRHRTLSH